MYLLQPGPAFAAALAALALSGAPAPARADIQDYEFRLGEAEVKQSDKAVLAVKIVHKPTGKPVPDAVIFARRLDMEPDGMAAMKAPLEPLPSTEPGVYRFRADLAMDGNWRLSLAAKVQGETDTLQARLFFKAVE